MTTKANDIQKDHPELRAGEVWLKNHDTDKDKHFGDGYSTLRVGRVAMDMHGAAVPGYVPVFVSREEFDEHKKRAL